METSVSVACSGGIGKNSSGSGGPRSGSISLSLALSPVVVEASSFM